MQPGFFHEVRKAIATEGRTDDSSDDEKGNDSDNNGDIPADKQFISRKRKNVDKKRLKRLRLDEALKNVDEGNFEGWSEARIRAWQLKDKNPNAYYYRFNDPGVEQRNGTWNKVPLPSPSHPTSSRALTLSCCLGSCMCSGGEGAVLPASGGDRRQRPVGHLLDGHPWARWLPVQQLLQVPSECHIDTHTCIAQTTC